MGLGSFGAISKLTNKANGLVNKVTTSKLFNQVFGAGSQLLRRFPTPQDVANIPDPLKNTQWEVVFPGINISPGLFSGKEGIGKVLNYNPIVEDISFAIPEIKTEELKIGPRTISMPVGKTTSSTFSATFYCDNSLSILTYFENWRKEIVSDDLLVGLESNYKKRVYLYILGLRSVMPVYVVKFKGVYPMKISSNISFKSTTKAERITMPISFYVDEIEFESLAVGQIATDLTNNFVGGVLTKMGSVSSIAGNFL